MSSPAPEDKKKEGEEHHDDVSMTKFCLDAFKPCGKVWIVLIITVLFGGFLFYKLEHEKELDEIARHEEEMDLVHETFLSYADELIAGTMTKDELWDYVVDNHEAYVSREEEWGYSASCFFAFTIMSTIGYGNVAPSHVLSQVCVILFAFVGIPIAATALGILSKSTLVIMEYVFSQALGETRIVFEHYDHSDDGTLDIHELLPALQELGMHGIDQDKVDKLLRQNLLLSEDDLKKPLTYKQFKLLVESCNLKVGKIARRLSALKAMAITMLTVILVAPVVYVTLEEEAEWTYWEGMYFIFISLTTIGLGDFVPSQVSSIIFHLIICFVGLNMLALTLSMAYEYFVEQVFYLYISIYRYRNIHTYIYQ